MSKIVISEPQIRRAVSGVDNTRLPDFVRTFNEWNDQFQINTPARVAHFLSQVMHESGGLHHVEENLNYSADGLLKTWPKRFTAETAAGYARQPERIANKVYANRMGNGTEASGDGWKYRGRGFIQLTGKSNYQAYASSEFCRGDLMRHPEWLAQSPGNLKSAMWFWQKNGLNELSDADDGGRIGETVVERITKRVNGGLLGIATRKLYYRKFKKEFGL